MGRPAVVIHVPHASTVIPHDVRPQFVLSDAELDAECRRMTDHLTDELFAMPSSVATTIRFPVSRLVVDPERFESDDHERMAARGMGAVYQRTVEGHPLRRALSTEERGQLIERWYRPHHAALTAAVSTALAAGGTCLVIDAHSFPSMPLPYEEDQARDRPDICIGTDEFHTPGAIADLAVTLCERAGWSVAVNRPFAGALVPMAHYRRDLRVQAVMVEVNRGLYLDESTGVRGRDFDTCRTTLSGVLHRLIDEVRLMPVLATGR